MFCPTCGARNTVGERFCRTCRTDLADPTAPSDVWAVAAPTAAPYDEFPIDPDPTLAAAIVAPLAPPIAPPAGSAGGPPTALVRRPPPEPRRSFIAPLLGVVALAVVAVGLVFLVASNQSGDDAGPATSVERTTASLSPDATALTTVAPISDSTATAATALALTTEPATTEPAITDPPITDPPITDPPITDPPITDPPTTPPTAPPTVPTTAAPTPNAVALAQLTTWAAEDAPLVEDVVDMWVPQVGAKKVGTKDDGIVYTLPDIAFNHQQFRDDLGAVLVDSGDYVFKNDNLWVSIIPEGFASSGGALDWCADHDLGPSECFAKLITHDESIKVTTAYQ